jgi:glycosyltransferase involved in cell wall biosynthesis
MRIGIDARILSKRMSGIGRYTYSLVDNISKFDQVNEYILFSHKKLNYKNNYVKTVISGISWLPGKLYSPIWLNFVLPSLLKKYNINILYCPNQLIPLKKLKCISIIVIPDVFYLFENKYHSWFYRLYLKTQLPQSIRKCDKIITISKNSKSDLLKHYKIQADKITVIPLNAEEKFHPLRLSHEEKQLKRKQLNLPDLYVLYVGVIENRKNILGILKIADIVFNTHPEVKTVLIGRSGYGFKNLLPEIQKRKDHVIYLNYIEDNLINLYYNLAFVFLFPSFYEGFGLPPLEAMQCGLPTLCSNTSSLKEVVGEDGITFLPDEHELFANEILRLFRNPVYYHEKSQYSLCQSKNFSLEYSINKLVQEFNKFK